MSDKIIKIILHDKELHNTLLKQCHIGLYDDIQDIEYLANEETISLECKVFAYDGDGGEYVLLEDNTIGFISSEAALDELQKT